MNGGAAWSRAVARLVPSHTAVGSYASGIALALRNSSYELLPSRFDFVSVSFEFRFRACVLPWVEILKTRQVEFTLYFSYVLSTQ